MLACEVSLAVIGLLLAFGVLSVVHPVVPVAPSIGAFALLAGTICAVQSRGSIALLRAPIQPNASSVLPSARLAQPEARAA